MSQEVSSGSSFFFQFEDIDSISEEELKKINTNSNILALLSSLNHLIKRKGILKKEHKIPDEKVGDIRRNILIIQYILDDISFRLTGEKLMEGWIDKSIKNLLLKFFNTVSGLQNSGMIDIQLSNKDDESKKVLTDEEFKKFSFNVGELIKWLDSFKPDELDSSVSSVVDDKKIKIGNVVR